MSTLYYESSFAHHGIKGQKWGVRRFQNPDGSLTSAGRRRQAKEISKNLGNDFKKHFSTGEFPDSARMVLNSPEVKKAFDNDLKARKPIRDFNNLPKDDWWRLSAKAIARSEWYNDKTKDSDPKFKEDYERIYNRFKKNNTSRKDAAFDVDREDVFYEYLKEKHINPISFYSKLDKTFEDVKLASEKVTKELLGVYGSKKLSGVGKPYKFENADFLNMMVKQLEHVEIDKLGGTLSSRFDDQDD